MKKIFLALTGSYLALFMNLHVAFAQTDTTGYNPNSLNPIHESDIMFKKRIWRRMDLKEKQNKPFFAYNKEITKFIIEGVEKGILTPYVNDSLETPMTKEIFLKNLKLPEEKSALSSEEKALGFTESDDTDWGSSTKNNPEKIDKNQPDYFLPNEVSVIEIMEDLIFDRKRSVMVPDIQSFKLIIPATKFETGFYREVAVFKYKDLAPYFDSMPKKAVWLNKQNTAENRKFTEAFDLRLFSARIVKMENPDNATVEDIYGDKALMASQWLEEQLLELEHNLWEY